MEFQKMMNQFMRASEFIDRISVQNMKMKPITKKAYDESISESKTARFNNSKFDTDEKSMNLELSLKTDDE